MKDVMDDITFATFVKNVIFQLIFTALNKTTLEQFAPAIRKKMEGPQVAFLVLLLALTGYLGNRLWAAINGPSYRERILRLASADQQLTNHTAEFARPEILQVN